MVGVPKTLSAILAVATLGYGAGFWVKTSLEADSAWSRFEALEARGNFGRAVGHGDQAIALLLEDGGQGDKVQAMQLRVARAHDAGGSSARAIELYRFVLDSPLGSRFTAEERAEVLSRVAALSLELGRAVDAAIIIADFVDRAGDAAADPNAVSADPQHARLIAYADSAMQGFTDLLQPVVDQEIIEGTERERLFAADRLTRLGGYYAARPDGSYAAAGLLAAAYRTRLDVLTADHQDTIHTALLLGPVYERIGRISDAEKIYLDAFHAQERAKGSNNPDLSLYIRLLADVYRRQGRVTEAEALNQHMRNLFRDAFGARRYAANQERDRMADINRPVSPEFPLPADYIPPDLIAATTFSIPTSKDPALEEMHVRAAIIDPETTLPKMLADLIGACRSDTEELSLRSGYRSYKTQVEIYGRRGEDGQVAKPGTSEHQSGLAVDIDVNGRFMRSTDRAYQCFESQAWRFGFILSFPHGNAYLPASDTFEPWHWRFVGPQTALLYREIGPLGFPQEFLAALPCYEERALTGLFLNAGEDDMCLASVRTAEATPAPAAPTPPPERG